ncbi:hypothetical protein BX616_008858 [Lobosporangium transversale]|uniref:J domain-containing protein n=1 Tax=Lobosporangium transversale TaxID=64571 RepID=A0A1Y2H491_9FUNG|nr:hypothetical protein BCR41DRAFT_392331 [Lobosporangium transversale]KAF9914150.1 hypothetical protein BX616_008858 [Lobosporangium transversale]ORZ27872.1 hypothetical protein BCR41DRAFT_392331 [Lobosporangium transversale]|eukprot:XP_021885575.1 hypothetical protein BCR41DRAFT_392331 [Lobosporangium transversale]
MEVNKDEALRCLDIAQRHLDNGNFQSARKFGLKSISLFPTPQGEAFITKVAVAEESASASTTSASASGNASHRTNSSPATSGTGHSSARPTSSPLRSRSTPSTAHTHKPVERDYTPEQVAMVKTIRSSGGDFYKVLGVKKDATDTEIKKAYRRLALQMHPDKNGAPGADEAFKIVSKAFTVLSDPQKRAIFDQHGPDENKNSSVNYDRATPTGHHPFGYSRRGGAYGEEISPEELFNMFFGGGGFGTPLHSTTFARPRAQQTHYHQQRQQHYRQQHQRQRQQRAARNNNFNNDDFGSGLGSFIQLLPFFLLILVTLTSSLFSSDSSYSSSSSPSNSILTDFSLRPKDQYTTARHTTIRNVPYFVNDVRFMNTYFPGQQFEFKSTGARQMNVKPDHVTLQGLHVGPLFKRMEENVELAYLRDMQVRCKDERRKKDEARNRAMGFWGADPKLWQEAQKMGTPSCEIIRQKYGKAYVR